MEKTNAARFRSGCMILLAALLSSCATSSGGKTGPLATAGDKLYTQFSLHYEKGTHITTNYRVGILVPVNTEVEFVKATRKRIVVNVPKYETELILENVKDFSGEDIEGIFTRTFATSPVDLSPFTQVEQRAIKSGQFEIGMSKDAVIVAMGYPPRHRTPSLELDQWRYWKNRWNTVLLSFEDDKLISVID